MKNIISHNFYQIFRFFPLLVFMFNPKIDIVSIPGFWQGVRLDDLIILFYSIYYFVSNNFKVYPNLINKNKFGLNWIIFFPYIIFSFILGSYFSTNPSLILFFRYCEYIALIIILNQINPSKDRILLLFKIYIFLNFIIVFLQYFEIIGGFTSRGGCLIDSSNEEGVSRCYDKEDIKNFCFLNCGYDFMKNYQPSGQFLLNRVPGITGGPWELSVNLAIIFYALVLFEKKIEKLIPFFIMIILMMIVAQSRGIIFGFLAGSLFLLNDYKKTFKFMSIFFIFLVIIFILNLFNFREIIYNKFVFDYYLLAKLVVNTFYGELPSESTIVSTPLESMYWRVVSWKEDIAILKKSNLTFLFGTGGTSIYNESLLIKSISSFGLVGFLIILYLIKKLPFFFLIFITVTGITFDLFVSFKVFTFSCLLIFLINNYKKEIIKR